MFDYREYLANSNAVKDQQDNLGFTEPVICYTDEHYQVGIVYYMKDKDDIAYIDRMLLVRIPDGNITVLSPEEVCDRFGVDPLFDAYREEYPDDLIRKSFAYEKLVDELCNSLAGGAPPASLAHYEELLRYLTPPNAFDPFIWKIGKDLLEQNSIS